MIASLEEVFLSKEFERFRARPRGVVEIAPDVPAPTALDARLSSTLVEPGPALEQIFLSDAFGRPRLVSVLPGQARSADAIGSVVVPFALRRRHGTSSRTMAAASGAAAAALVIAGVAGGGGHPAHPTIAAEGQRPARHAPRGDAVPATSRNAAVTPDGTPHASTATVGTAHTTQAARPPTAPANSGQPAATATVVPSAGTANPAPSAPPSSPGPASTPGGFGPGSGLGQVTGSFGNTVTIVGTNVSAAAGEIGSSVSAAAPVSRALSGVATTVGALGQTVGLTTA